MTSRVDAYLCRACRKRAVAEGARTCSPCLDVLADMLRPDNHGNPDADEHPSIPVLYGRLDPTPPVVDRERRCTGYTAASPADEHVIVMRDRRSKCSPVVDVWEGADGAEHHEDEHPPRAVQRAIAALTASVHEDRGFTAALPTTLAEQCAWLVNQLDWLTRRDRVSDDARYLRDLRNDLLAATGDPRPKPVGWCIRLDVDTDTECGAPIYLPPGHGDLAVDTPISELPTLRCPYGHEYAGLEVVRLRLANAQHEAA